MDIAERRLEDDAGLSNVVHSVAWLVDGSQWELIIDFGSALVEALLEFFRALASACVTECCIGGEQPPAGGSTLQP